jgi:hypothetical protein
MIPILMYVKPALKIAANAYQITLIVVLNAFPHYYCKIKHVNKTVKMDLVTIFQIIFAGNAKIVVPVLRIIKHAPVVTLLIFFI